MIHRLSKHSFVRDDGKVFFLGRKCKLTDSRTLRLQFSTKDRFVDPELLPPLVAQTHWLDNLTAGDFPMDLNDSLGDCTCAAQAHLVTSITANSGNPGRIVPSASAVLTMYEASGYKPGEPSTDNGWTLYQAAKYMQQTGLAGVKADAYCDIGIGEYDIKYAVQLFGGCILGVHLPQSAMESFGRGVWSDISDTDILGDHALAFLDFTPNGAVCATWGGLQAATWDWVLAYTDEAQVLLFYDWIRRNGTAPSGLDLAALDAARAKLQA